MEHTEGMVDPSASVLGSLEHWNNAYVRELANLKDNGEDIGEVWFGNDVQERVCDWIAQGSQDDDGEDNLDQCKGSDVFPGIICTKSTVLDIGCGNAAALVYLASEWNFQHLTGIDYSEPGIELAKMVVTRQEATQHIHLEVIDLMDLKGLHQRHNDGKGLKYDLLFDKGTFDAICLNEDKTMRSKYVAAVCSMMTASSYFVITSCNWTQSEVVHMFESMSSFNSRASSHESLASIYDHASRSLKLFKTLKHPEFSFGGKTGSTVATVAFKFTK